MNPEWHVTDWMKFSKDGGPINKQEIVLKAAKAIIKERAEKGWTQEFSAYQIQKKLFPKVKVYCAAASGISGAIQGLKRRGLVHTSAGFGNGWYGISESTQ